MRQALTVAALLCLLALAAACGSGGDDDGTTQTATAAGTVAVTPTHVPLAPPFEGKPLPTSPAAGINFRESPDWRLPSPDELPAPPASEKGAEFHTPATPTCPDGWNKYERPREGFVICYPSGWVVGGEGYVTQAFQDRWFTAGVFDYAGKVQAAHVSIYVINNNAPPLTYTRDCDYAYSITFAGKPAVICNDVKGNSPEAQFIVYHVRTAQFDYFVNVVPYFTYNASTDSYGDSVDPDVKALAIQVAQTFQLTTPLGQ